jgi:tetratricopeptide (TPR) repeat protein
LDAFNNVAAELLQHNVSNVITIPTDLRPEFAGAFYRDLYHNLGEGETVIRSLSAARKATQAIDKRATTGERRLNWGVPVLYQRTSNLRPVSHPSDSGRMDHHDPVILPCPAATALLGRRAELQMVRGALQADAQIAGDTQSGYARTIFIWGSDGVGRSCFVNRILNPNGYKPATLTIQCRAELEPLGILGKLVNFWRDHAPETYKPAAELLLDTSLPPFERARDAQEILGDRLFHVLLEDIDTWFEPATDPSNPGTMPDATLRDILLGLLHARSKSVFVLTSTRRWQGLTTLPKERRREIYLPPLSERYAIQLMNRWANLRALPLREKHAIFWHVGGHPKTLEYLATWMTLGYDLRSSINRLEVADRTPEAWLDHYLDGILRSLDPGEYDVLTTMAVLRSPFSAKTMSKLTHVTLRHAKPLLTKWQKLGLIEPIPMANGGQDREPPLQAYALHTTLQKAIVRRISPEEIQRFHQQIALYYSAPFVDAARRQVLTRNMTQWSEDKIAWLARDSNGILGVWLRRHQDELQKARVIHQALAWQYHLIGAQLYQEAVHVVQTIAPELNNLGMRDLSKALLQRVLEFVGDLDPTIGMNVLAKLRMEEGHLEAALQVYEEVYASLDPDEAKLQRAHVLMRAGSVYQRLGELDSARESFKEALEIARDIVDREGEAECLYQLAVTLRQARDYKRALVYSQAAKEHCEGLSYSYGLTAIEHEQGHILKAMGRPESALERFAASLRICRKLDDQECMADNLMEIGQLFHDLGNTKMAVKALEEAQEIYTAISSPKREIVHTLLTRLDDENLRHTYV